MSVDNAIFDRLARSECRSRFHLGTRERDYAFAKGRDVIADHARAFIAERLAPENPRNDGRHPPMRGHPVFIAQHAAACCCRSCLEKWHKIPRGRELDVGKQAFVVTLLMRWIDRKIRQSQSGS